MWYLYSQGRRWEAKVIYLKIWKKYGCCIYPYAEVGKGFSIAHPVGIVIGRCKIGENFCIFQNATIGSAHKGDEEKRLCPVIGNNTVLYANAMVIGGVTVADNVIVGAGSIVMKNISNLGTYVGIPALKIR